MAESEGTSEEREHLNRVVAKLEETNAEIEQAALFLESRVKRKKYFASPDDPYLKAQILRGIQDSIKGHVAQISNFPESPESST